MTEVTKEQLQELVTSGAAYIFVNGDLDRWYEAHRETYTVEDLQEIARKYGPLMDLVSERLPDVAEKMVAELLEKNPDGIGK